MSERKKIRLRVTFEVDGIVPEDWDEDMIMFHYNESSYCKDNLLRDKLLETKEVGCSCFEGDVELVKDYVWHEEQ
jgi:hypothetical protein